MSQRLTTRLTAAQQELVLEHLALAKRLAHAAKRRCHDRRWDDEFYSEAVYALVRAARSYDATVVPDPAPYFSRAITRGLRRLYQRLFGPEPCPGYRPRRVLLPRGRVKSPLEATPAPVGHDPMAFDDLLTGLSPTARADLGKRFVERKTLVEMAREEQTTKQAIHHRIGTALAELRRLRDPA